MINLNKLKIAKPEKKGEASSIRGILVGLYAAFGGILFGYDTGLANGILAMDYVNKEFPKNGTSFSSDEKSLIVSILSVGTFFGAISAPLLSDTLGRRWTIIIATLFVFNLGVILQTASTDIPLLCAGRAIAGFGVGLVSAVVPLYQSETTPKWIRGAIVSCYQWAITFGLLLAALVNQGTNKRNDSGSYRIPIAIQFLWGLILGVGLIFLPETPRFYISKFKDDKAKRSLRFLRNLPEDHPELIAEYDEMKAAFEFELSFGKASWKKIFSTNNKQLKRLFTGVGVQAFQQLTGVNFIFYYGTTFFQSSGIENEFMISVATNVVNVGMNIAGVFLVELMGRRNLLLTGSVVMASSQLIIAIVGAASNSGAADKVLVAFSCIFIGGFGSSWGPACWAVVGEIFPLTTRAKSVAMSAASNWIFNWALAFVTPYLVDKEHANLKTNVFFIWGGFNCLGGFFAWLFVYETKGLTLEQVDELYECVDNAWQSQKFVPSEVGFRNDQDLLQSDGEIKEEEVRQENKV